MPKKNNEYLELLCCQRLEDKLTRTGYSGSTASLKALMAAHNRRFGTKLKNLSDTATYLGFNFGRGR